MPAPTITLPTTGTDPKVATKADLETQVNNALEANYDNVEAHKVRVDNPHSVTATQVGLGNADNTSDADKPVSTAQQTALDEKASDSVAFRVLLPQTNNGAYINLRTNGGVRQVGFPNYRIEEVGSAAVTVGDTAGHTYFDLQTAVNDQTYYYLSVSGDSLNVTATKADAYPTSLADDGIVRLGWSQSGEFIPDPGNQLRIVDEDDERRFTQAASIGHEELAEALVLGSNLPGDVGPGTSAFVIDNAAAGGKPFPIQFPWKTTQQYRVDSGETVDVTRMMNGHSVRIQAKASGSSINVYIDPDLPMVGGFNNIEVPAGEAITVYATGGLPAQGWTFDASWGATPVTSTVARIIHGASLVMAGQSYAVQWFNNGGIGGLAYGVTDGSWVDTVVAYDYHVINGAVGSTGIFNDWRDVLGDTDGPQATNFKTVVNAEITKGQPAPVVGILEFGRADSGEIDSGGKTVAELKAAALDTLDSLETVCGVGMKWLIRSPGYEQRWGRERGMSGSRQAWLEIISERANCYDAGQSYDLPRNIEDPHAKPKTNFIMGYRDARALRNAVNGQTNDMGPTYNTAVLEDSNFAVRVSITSTENLRMPVGDATETTTRVKAAPWLFAIIPAGEDAGSADPVQCWGEIDGADVVLHATQDLTGCRVMYPYGSEMPDAQTRNVVRNNEKHCDIIGLPLIPFITGVL